MIDLKLPSFTDNQLDDAKERKQIKEYLVLLTKQLKYYLNNIDIENLSTGLTQTIQNNSKATEQLASNLTDVNNAVIKTEKNATQLSLTAENALRSTVLVLKMADVELARVTIQFTGNFVTAEQLEEYEASKLTGATGTFSSLSSSSGAVQLGDSEITASKLYATGAATAQDGETYYPVYIKANGELIRAVNPAEGS
jgi:flagellar hook-basal body complex protein FliE